MNRLTYKKNWYDEFGNKHSYHSEDNYCIEKLGKLEDLEEELGIDLITLFKALKNGVCVKENMTPETTCFTKYTVDCFVYNEQYEEYGFGYGKDCFSDKPLWWLSLKDYKKTWALNRSDLEDELLLCKSKHSGATLR